MKTKRLSSVFAGKLNVNMKPTLAAAKFKNQQTKKQSEILEQEEEEEDIISSGNAYLIRGLGEVIFGISADLFYCCKVLKKKFQKNTRSDKTSLKSLRLRKLLD